MTGGGKVFIKKSEYNRLRACELEMDVLNGKLHDCNLLKCSLEKEIKELSEMISAQVKDCQVGPWCTDCDHYGHSISTIKGWGFTSEYVRASAGEVQYCKKHLHDLCPEFEARVRGWATLQKNPLGLGTKE
jgi:hypothetical protein